MNIKTLLQTNPSDIALDKAEQKLKSLPEQELIELLKEELNTCDVSDPIWHNFLSRFKPTLLKIRNESRANAYNGNKTQPQTRTITVPIVVVDEPNPLDKYYDLGYDIYDDNNDGVITTKILYNEEVIFQDESKEGTHSDVLLKFLNRHYKINNVIDETSE